jgi:hypothetical protein
MEPPNPDAHSLSPGVRGGKRQGPQSNGSSPTDTWLHDGGFMTGASWCQSRHNDLLGAHPPLGCLPGWDVAAEIIWR